MRFEILIIALLLGASSYVLAQDPAIPESVRQAILRSQTGSQHEQMARMQLDAYYRDYIDALEADENRRRQIEDAFVVVLRERAELSDAVAQGRASTAQLAEISDYAFLRGRVEPLLSAAELALLDARQGGPSDAQLKQQYAGELLRTAPGVSDADRELVLTTLVRHLRADHGDAADLAGLSVEELVNRQSMAIMHAGEELQSQLSPDVWGQVAGFLRQLQGNLFLNRSMSETAQ
jgi:hypothetical protein